jgi:ATP-binding cassette subfamily B protein
MTDELAPARGVRAAARRAIPVWILCWRAGPAVCLALAAVNVVSGLLPAAVPVLTKLVVDDLAAGRGSGAVLAPALGLAAAGLAAAALPHVADFLQRELGRRINRTAQGELYGAVNAFDGLARFESPTLQDRLRLAGQAGQALGPATTGLFGVGRNALGLVSLLATLAAIAPEMAALVLLAGAPTLATELWLGRQRTRVIAQASPATRRRVFYGLLLTDVQAAKEIRLFSLGDFLRGRMLAELDSVQRDERAFDVRELGLQSLLAALGAVLAGLGLLWTIMGAAGGRLSLGDVTAFIAAMAGAQGALAGLVISVARAHEALLLFGYHIDVTTLDNDLPRGGRGTLGELTGCVELRDVWFRYADDQPWVLRGVTLTIPRGKAVALVGLNGAGKSTVVKLLCRFYDPARGSIAWDGVDIREVPVQELRARMGVLFQDFMSYDLTAAENIGMGDLDHLADRARVAAAAERAGVAGTIADLPRGYRTLLSRIFADPSSDGIESGVVLSGGQWQRLALARAFMRDRRDFLILDEPSSGLDAEAEHRVHERLRRHRGGRTSLLISHRLGAVRDADEIVVLAEGRIAERGTHHDLTAQGGQYARLFALQAKGYREEASAFSSRP